MVGPTVDEVVVKNRLRRWPKEAGNRYCGRGWLAEDWRVNFGTDQMRFGRKPHELLNQRYACNHVVNIVVNCDQSGVWAAPVSVR
jgi:hypothetical protein